MDRRIAKTKSAIRNAFMTLRTKKELEKITVKELCEVADINKSTFYVHYKDIFDLSTQLGNDAVLRVLKNISSDEDYTLFNPEAFTRELIISFDKYRDELKILFSGNQSSSFGTIIEKEIKRAIFEAHPELENHAGFNILLSYCIQGSYNAQINNPQVPLEEQVTIITEIVSTLRPLFESKQD